MVLSSAFVVRGLSRTSRETMSALPTSTMSSLNPEGVQCPLCSSRDTRPLSEWNDRSLRRCSGCDVTFLHPQPSLEACAEHFEQAPPLTPAQLKNKFEKNRARVLARVAAQIQSSKSMGRILDVGCATGVFLSQYFPATWERWGVDLSGIAAQQAAECGVYARQGNIRDVNFADNSFDVVTVLDAFYYFRSPQDELAEIRRVLKDDGLLALELPLATSRIWRNSSRIGRLLSGAREPLLLTSDHLFYFTPSTVERLLRRTGFSVSRIMALPGNRQTGLLRDVAMRSYSEIFFALKVISRSRIFLAPRFLVLATKSAVAR